MLKLENLSEEQFNKLKDSGMLWEVFPEAPFSYLELVRERKKQEVIEHCREKLEEATDQFSIEYDCLCEAVFQLILDDVPDKIKVNTLKLEDLLDEEDED